MKFEFDEFSDTLWVSLSEPQFPCVYVESETLGVFLRLEESTGVVRDIQITSWTRRIKVGSVLVPEVSNHDFAARWKADHSGLAHQ